MSVPTPLRDPDENTARAVARSNPGLQGGRRAGLAPVRSRAARAQTSSDEWVVVEAEADISPKSHPYLSFDPDGTY